jgi:hypothetical protein
MATNSSATLPDIDLYELNRQRFTAVELAPYANQWVAFSLDGQRIITAAPSFLALDKQLVAIGEDPQHVGLEFLTAEDGSAGSAGLGG